MVVWRLAPPLLSGFVGVVRVVGGVGCSVVLGVGCGVWGWGGGWKERGAVRVAMIVDAGFVRREASMINRLAIGFLDEGLVVELIGPRSLGLQPRSGPVRWSLWEDRGFGLTMGLRVRGVVGSLADRDAPPDVVHAFGTAAWAPAERVASSFGSSLVLDVNSRASLDRAVRRLSGGGGSGEDGSGGARAAYVCADRVIGEALSSAVEGGVVRSVPWGVHRAPPRGGAGREVWGGAVEDVERPVSVCVLGEDGAPAFVDPVLRGLASVESPFLAFLDEASVRGAHGRLWRTVESLGLSERVDVSPGLEANRDVTLRCDVLVVPGPTGRHRSLVLEAMAGSMCVVASPDGLIECLSRDGLFYSAGSGDEAGYAAAIESACRDVIEGAEGGVRGAARTYADEERRPWAHISGLMELYGELVGPEAIAFRGRGAG